MLAESRRERSVFGRNDAAVFVRYAKIPGRSLGWRSVDARVGACGTAAADVKRTRASRRVALEGVIESHGGGAGLLAAACGHNEQPDVLRTWERHETI